MAGPIIDLRTMRRREFTGLESSGRVQIYSGTYITNIIMRTYIYVCGGYRNFYNHELISLNRAIVHLYVLEKRYDNMKHILLEEHAMPHTLLDT
jgi:hypothetical protein